MKRLLTLAILGGSLLAPGEALADFAPPDPTARPAEAPGAQKHAVVWPTLTPAGDDASPTPVHRPTSVDGPLATRAQELDATLRDATQDLGFVLDLNDSGPSPGRFRDTDMVARAGKPRPGDPADAGAWVVSARLEQEGGDSFLLRLVVARPGSKELRTRVEVVSGADVSLRGLVMLRALLAPDVVVRGAEPCEPERGKGEGATAGTVAATPARSTGRAVLAANDALFGGYVGYSLVRSTGSNDPRVLYPLMTLGTVVGIGGALLASEEWDIGTGDAWFLSAGAWWGAGSGMLIAYGTNAQPSEGPYSWGIGGGAVGMALGTLALTRGHMDEGDATLTNSGAALGVLLGGLVELGYRERTDVTPYTGAGIGSAIGLVGAGVVSMFVEVPPSRVLLIDLGAGVGTLTGAATGSPLIFSDLSGARTSGANTRLFLGGTFAGTVAGGVVGWYLTRSMPPKTSAWLNGLPSAGIIGQTQTATGQVPAYGLSYAGAF